MPDRRARGRLPKIDPLPHDIATAFPTVGTRIEVPAGGALYRQGETAERLFAIGAGYLKMTSESARGHSVVAALLGPGYIVGTAGLSTPPVYTFNALAADPVTVYGWTRGQTETLARHPAFRHYLDQLTHHYTEILATRLHSLSDGPVAERLAAALLELATMHGVPAGHGGLIEIAPSVSLEDLGGLAGTTTEIVRRFVTQWRDAGAVLTRIGKRRVSLYPERLREAVWRSRGLLPAGGTAL